MTYAVLCPGQGAQFPGMGADFRSEPLFEETLMQADAVIPGLLNCIYEGQNDLNATCWAQPALLTLSVGLWRLWQNAVSIAPVAVAGHSLGEYTALVVAEVLSFEQALQLVALRGELMQKACETNPGGLLAVVRANKSALEAYCKETEGIWLANENSPSQMVLSGHLEALDRARKRIQSEKWGRGIPLKVAGAFHSPLMASAEEALNAALEAASFTRARIPVISNTDGQLASDADILKSKLKAQLLSPVKWQESMLTLAEQTQHILELGVKPVVSKLALQTQKSLVTKCLKQQSELQGF